MLMSLWTRTSLSDVVEVAPVGDGCVASALQRAGSYGHAEVVEDLVVEAVLAPEALVDVAQEQPGLRTLDDAVVVGRGERDHLADAQLGERARVGGLEARSASRSRRRRRSPPGPA